MPSPPTWIGLRSPAAADRSRKRKMRILMRLAAVSLLALCGASTLEAAQHYNPTGSVGSLEPAKPSKRRGPVVADSVKPFSSQVGPMPASVVQLPRHCDFDNTLPGCPGADDDPPPLGGDSDDGGTLAWRATGYSTGPGTGCHMGAEQARAQQLVAQGVLKPDLSPVQECTASSEGALVV